MLKTKITAPNGNNLHPNLGRKTKENHRLKFEEKVIKKLFF